MVEAFAVGKTKKIYDLKFSQKKDLYAASQIKDNVFHHENFFIRTSKRNIQKVNKFEKYRNNNNYKGYEPKKVFEKPRPRNKTYSYEGDFKLGYKKKDLVKQNKIELVKEKIELVKNKLFNGEIIRKEKKVQRKKAKSGYLSNNPFAALQTGDDDDDSDF